MNYKVAEPIKLFPAVAPGYENIVLEEQTRTTPWKENLEKTVVFDVTNPVMTPYIPEKPNGMAALVIPGGYYERMVYNIEGLEVAKWLAEQGITAFVLKYRLPDATLENAVEIPFQDVQRAMRHIRKLSGTYGINPNGIGVMGFSSGGHLAARLSTNYDLVIYEAIDELDTISCKPDFTVLGYPLISLEAAAEAGLVGNKQHPLIGSVVQKYSVEQWVTKDTPTAFIFETDNDEATLAENSINYYMALRKNHISAELHILKKGGHGFGLGKADAYTAQWTKLCENWLMDIRDQLLSKE